MRLMNCQRSVKFPCITFVFIAMMAHCCLPASCCSHDTDGSQFVKCNLETKVGLSSRNVHIFIVVDDGRLLFKPKSDLRVDMMDQGSM